MEYLFSEPYLAYVIGAVGYILYVVSSYMMSRVNMFGLEALGCVLVTVQWLMLDQVMPAALNFAYAYVSVCGIFVIRHKWVQVLFPAVFPFIIMAYILYGTGSTIDNLVLAVAIPTLGVRYIKSMNVIRGVLFSGALSIMFVNISSGVVVGLISNICYAIGHANYFVDKYRKGQALKTLSTST